MDALEKLKHCRICGKELSPGLQSLAKHRLEQVNCSSECQMQDIKNRFACCDQAVPVNCVCVYAFKCPVHGEKHVGSHD